MPPDAGFDSSATSETAAAGRSTALSSAALASAILSYLCLWGIGGFVAVVLGVVARAEKPQTRQAARLATAAIVFGALNVIGTIALLAVAISRLADITTEASSSAAIPMVSPTPRVAPAPWVAAPPRPAPSASFENGVIATQLGRIVLVDVPQEITSLNHELNEQRSAAERAGQTLLLWLVAPDCMPCNGVAAALMDPRMQSALAGVRLVRLDILDHAFDLDRSNLPSEKIPGFVLLTARNRPLDYVHGGEWDEDVPENIAPVLGEFIRGRYTQRRDPWRGGRREDETPIGYFW